MSPNVIHYYDRVYSLPELCYAEAGHHGRGPYMQLAVKVPRSDLECISTASFSCELAELFLT